MTDTEMMDKELVEQTVDAHVCDVRGVYVHTLVLSIYAEQPAGAIYNSDGDILPPTSPGHTRVRVNGAWVQVPDADVPQMPEPQVPPDPVPASCTRRQGLRALIAYGFMPSQIEALIEAIPDEVQRELTRVDYEAATWERGDESLQAMWTQLGGTPEQLDDLFRVAATL